MKKVITVILFILILAAFTAGCNLPTAVSGPDSAQVAQTYAAQTIEARLTENAAGSGGQPSDGGGQNPQATTQVPDQPPTDTPKPTNTPTITPTATKEKPCNQAGFVKDVSVPDGSEYAPGAAFTKTWRLKNTGTCTWNSDYDLVFDHGDKMGGSNVEDINPGSVSPGDTVDISVDLTAPGSTGDYRGYWLLRSDDGVVFGLGDSDTAFFVDIEVVEAVSFDITGTNVYSCGVDTFISLRIKNTGTEELESKKGSVKNLNTDAVFNYSPWDTPFTENDDDCPAMGIDNMDPGDIYWTTYNMGSSSGVEYKFTVTLCTAEGGGGDCATKTQNVTIP